MLSVFSMMTYATDVKYLYNDGFNATDPDFDTKYFSNDVVCSVVTTNPQEGLGCLEVEKKQWWGSPRIFINKDNYKFDQIYSISFWVKFKNDIDQFSFQLGLSDGSSIVVFLNMNVTSDWIHMSGTFNFKDICEINGKDFTDLPAGSEDTSQQWQLAFIASDGNTSTFYMDEFIIVEGDTIPGVKANDNDTWRTYNQEEPTVTSEDIVISTPSITPTTSSKNSALKDSNTPIETSSTIEDGKIIDTSTNTSLETDAEGMSAISSNISSESTSGEPNSKSPLILITIILVIILGCGGAITYILLKKRKVSSN